MKSSDIHFNAILEYHSSIHIIRGSLRPNTFTQKFYILLNVKLQVSLGRQVSIQEICLIWNGIVIDGVCSLIAPGVIVEAIIKIIEI